MKRIFLGGFLLSLSFISQASQIRIVASPQFDFKKEKGRVQIEGSYSMKNAGDEMAKNVYPHLFLDLFDIQGNPVDLKPGQEHVWKWKQWISSVKFCENKNAQCVVPLPLKGQILLRIQNHYQDANSYAFAVPQLAVTGFAKADSQLSPQAMTVLKVKKISEDTFQGDYEVHNQLDVPMNLKLDAVLPQEVEILSPLAPILLKEKASLFGTFQFRNKKGLQGSRYYAYVTAQWENAGERKVSWAFAPFFIGDQPVEIHGEGPRWRFSYDQIFWGIWGIVAFIGLFLMSRFWLKPLRKHR